MEAGVGNEVVADCVGFAVGTRFPRSSASVSASRAARPSSVGAGADSAAGFGAAGAAGGRLRPTTFGANFLPPAFSVRGQRTALTIAPRHGRALLMKELPMLVTAGRGAEGLSAGCGAAAEAPSSVAMGPAMAVFWVKEVKGAFAGENGEKSRSRPLVSRPAGPNSIMARALLTAFGLAPRLVAWSEPWISRGKDSPFFLHLPPDTTRHAPACVARPILFPQPPIRPSFSALHDLRGSVVSVAPARRSHVGSDEGRNKDCSRSIA